MPYARIDIAPGDGAQTDTALIAALADHTIAIDSIFVSCDRQVNFMIEEGSTVLFRQFLGVDGGSKHDAPQDKPPNKKRWVFDDTTANTALTYTTDAAAGLFALIHYEYVAT